MENASKSSQVDKIYEIPDGTVITFGNERFRCPELLFNPFINYMEYDGIDKMIYDSIMKCKQELHKELFKNIILSGGNAMFKGLPERIKKEIERVDPMYHIVRVIQHSDANYAAWNGGSILASLATFPQMCITKEEFEEEGAQIVHRKCNNQN